MNPEREQILHRVRAALAPLPRRAALPDWETDLVRARALAPPTDPWELFRERFRAVHGVPLASPAEVIALLRQHGASRGYCDPTWWPALRAHFPADFVVETTFDRARVDAYAFGLTAASGAIAETGTLVLTDAGTSTRLSALAPWVHIALLHRAQLHADLPAALAAMPADPNIIWVTGPSKTADVEGILIEGVHGPGVQAAWLLD